MSKKKAKKKTKTLIGKEVLIGPRTFTITAVFQHRITLTDGNMQVSLSKNSLVLQGLII